MKVTLSRRDFVRSTGLAAAACTLASSIPAASSNTPPDETGSGIRLGLASYTFRDFDRAHLIGFMKQLKISDLNAKNVKDHLPADPAEENTALSDYAAANIKLHAAGVVYFPKDHDGDIRAKFEYGKRASLPVIVGSPGSVAILHRMERFVKEYDIRIAIHNHGPEDPLWPSPLDVLKAVRSMDRRLGCCIDVGHTARTGTDVVEAIRAAGPRLLNIHMKDLTDFHSKESQVAVGDGKMPVRAIFQALRSMHYDGFVDLEYEVYPDNPMPGVVASFAYMRGVIAGMAD